MLLVLVCGHWFAPVPGLKSFLLSIFLPAFRYSFILPVVSLLLLVELVLRCNVELVLRCNPRPVGSLGIINNGVFPSVFKQ
jgi:hypothetical protein